MGVSQGGGVSIGDGAVLPPGTTVASGIAMLDFGDTPAPEAQLTITGQTGILSTSNIRISLQGDTTAFNNENDHLLLSRSIKLAAGVSAPGDGFTIYAESDFALWTKTFSIHWSWWN